MAVDEEDKVFAIQRPAPLDFPLERRQALLCALNAMMCAPPQLQPPSLPPCPAIVFAIPNLHHQSQLKSTSCQLQAHPCLPPDNPCINLDPKFGQLLDCTPGIYDEIVCDGLRTDWPLIKPESTPLS